MDKDYKKLIKAHTKKLNDLNQQNINSLEADPEYFVAYLQLIRDRMILSEPLLNGESENMKIATIATAIKEYQNYCTCVYKYFDVDLKTQVATQKMEGTKEEVTEKYRKEKAYHWNAFWEIVKDNLESWRLLNATI